MRTRGAFCLSIALVGILSLTACDSPPTPPPTSPGQLWVKVYVVRDLNDDGYDPKHGYEWSDSHIVNLVNQAIRSNVITGTNQWVQWTPQVIPIIDNLMSNNKLYLSYVDWATLLGTMGQVRDDYNNDGVVSIFFVPGIIDASLPGRFMDTYTLDPAYNQESAFWNQFDPRPVPSIYISDCWVFWDIMAHGTKPTGASTSSEPPGRIDMWAQMQKLIVERALGRFLLRFETAPDPWDNQEYYSGSPPDAYMAWWNERGRTPVAQSPALNKLSTNPLAP